MTFTIGNGAKNWLRSVWTLLITAATIGIFLFLRWRAYPHWWLWLGWLIGWTIGIFWYVPAYCRSLKGWLDGTAVHVEDGVWWHRHTMVPLSSLRTFEVWSLPLHRLFGCRTVILRFAGGSTRLPLLDTETVARLTALLEKQGDLT